MEQYANPVYKKQYLRGYAFGMNPAFHDCEDPRRIVPPIHDAAFLLGFDNGRQGYENFNGPLCDGIPERIVTDKLLQQIGIDGQLGEPLDLSGYTLQQHEFITKAYYEGAENFDAAHSIALQNLLKSLDL